MDIFMDIHINSRFSTSHDVWLLLCHFATVVVFFEPSVYLEDQKWLNGQTSSNVENTDLQNF